MTTKADEEFQDFDSTEAVEEKPKPKTRAKKAVKKEEPTDMNFQTIQPRWVVKVTSSHPAASKFFKFNVPHPKKPNMPLLIEGRCGVEIEDGLTQYMIDCLEKAYYTEMEEIPESERTGDVGLSHRPVKHPLYNVRKLREVKDPKPVGRGGR